MVEKIHVTGYGAVVELVCAQCRLDAENGLSTAGFVTGYRGSPLAGLDIEMGRQRERLYKAGIVFEPALNEALAAVAVMGTQMVESRPDRTCDGVFGVWYGKGPGVDWAGDAIEHGNAYGSSPHGGVVLLVGDDHGGVSSSMSHQSDHTLASWGVPVVAPSSVSELVKAGLYAFALSRASGCWVAVKCIAEIIEAAGPVELPDPGLRWETPDLSDLGDLHYRLLDPPGMLPEKRLLAKLEAARRFARANRIDRIVPGDGELAIVTVGKAHADFLGAKVLLGGGVERLPVCKVVQSFPLDEKTLLEFATFRDHRAILVLEEKKPFVETALRDLLHRNGVDIPVVGKVGFDGSSRFLPTVEELRPEIVADAVRDLLAATKARVSVGWQGRRPIPSGVEKRLPWYCAGCPHSRSTTVLPGYTAFSGIGCHIMALWMPDRPTVGMVHMGGEGAQWVSAHRFVRENLAFQNMGDGTFYHSGSLSLRYAVATRTPIVYRILYNDAVAMTGGQPIDGPVDPAKVVEMVLAEGVRRVAVVGDNLDAWRGRIKAASTVYGPDVVVSFHGRRELREVEWGIVHHADRSDGPWVILYVQTCASERRRRWKRKPPKTRVWPWIATSVCENCGHCAEVSNCLAVTSVKTEEGRKKRIDLSTCNNDLSCVEGFCPSFVTVEAEGLEWRDPLGDDVDETLGPLPEVANGRGSVLLAGVGGTGIVTAARILAKAAERAGIEATTLDFSGLAQKGGPVLSHVRIGQPGLPPRLFEGGADVLLGLDPFVAASADALTYVGDGTEALVSSDAAPLPQGLHDPDFEPDIGAALDVLSTRVGTLTTAPFGRLAREKIGDGQVANIVMLGYAAEKRLLPVPGSALAGVIDEGGEKWKTAFRLGRAAARALGAADLPPEPEPLGRAGMALRLREWGGDRAAARYGELCGLGDEIAGLTGRKELAEIVEKAAFRVLLVKDEYEVARLLTDPAFERELHSKFRGIRKIRYHLAPPLFERVVDPYTELPKKWTFGPWLRPLLVLLAKMRNVRGTKMDLFRFLPHRREAERVATAYEDDLRRLVEVLEAAEKDERVADRRILADFLSWPLSIRGYGPLRSTTVTKAMEERKRLASAMTGVGRASRS